MNRSTKRGLGATLALLSLGAVASARQATAGARRPTPGADYRDTPFWRVYTAITEAIDRRFAWHGVPVPIGLFTLSGIRTTLRRENLYDTSREPTVDPPPVPPFDPSYRTTRTPDGSYNDLEEPEMGMAGARFGRNFPIERTWPEPASSILDPNPRTVSRELLTRHEFTPAETVNALVPAWLQWMIRDWFSHGKSPIEDPFLIDVADDDPWPGERPMQIMRTRPDPTRPPDATDTPPTFQNVETHWWDASQIYGSSRAHQEHLRSGEHGKLRVEEGRLPRPPEDPQRNPAMVPGFWLGLAMLQTLFTLEHNAICDRLREAYPNWSDDELFERARLVNVALIAKIHTVEWTPRVIDHPTMRIAMPANWWGLLGDRFKRTFGRVGGGEALSGIVGTKTAHFGVPYSLTEEFVTVYRMHPLIADDWSFRALSSDATLADPTFRDLTGPGGLELMDRFELTDLFYSFGTQHPGVVTLHNFPRFLQEFERPDGKFMDMGAIDVLRPREVGVPRYNDFRRLLHMPAAESFEDLTDNPAWAEEIREVYNDDIERVDVTVGLAAEPLPVGYAFSDTAFRIFVLMASRRLNSDRFFTHDYRPEVYSPEGLQWVDENTMVTVLLRHYPELRPAMRGLDNAFRPWARSA